MNTKYIISFISLFLTFQVQAQTSYIILDGYGEDASYLSFKENLGQVLNDSLDSVPEIKYYCTQMESKLWIQEEGLVSWTALKEAVEDTLPDTLYRIDMQPYMEASPINTGESIVAEEPTGALGHYYLPHCGTNGVEDVEQYQRITWPNIYPDIHQQVYSNNMGFKYYYIVEPGGDPDDINIQFTGQDQMTVSPTKLDFYIDQMMMTLDNALAYEIDGSNQVVALSWAPTFVDEGNGSITISTGTYNTSNTLVIQLGAPNVTTSGATNPGSMEYSSYLTADKRDEVKEIKTRSSNGHIYMLGETTSDNFPVLKGKKATYKNKNDVILFHFDEDMRPEEYAYLGTQKKDVGSALVIDNFGNVHVAGHALGPTIQGVSGSKPSSSMYYSGYISTFGFDLKILGSQWYGTNLGTYITDMEIDNSNRLVIVGYAQRQGTGNLPLTNLGSGAYYQSNPHTTINGGVDGFIARMNLSGTFDHSTWFGGDQNDQFLALDIDNSGTIYALMKTEQSANASQSTCGVTSNNTLPHCTATGKHPDGPVGSDDYYLAEFNSGMQLKWSTWLGSPEADKTSTGGFAGADIKVDNNQPSVLYVAMATEKPKNFTKSAATGGFILNPTTQMDHVMLLKFVNGALNWHTALGCSGAPTGNPSLEMDDKENVFLTGATRCTIPAPSGIYCQTTQFVPNKFPLCDNGSQLFFQNSTSSNTLNPSDAFYMAFDKNNNMKWSTWFGGGNSDESNALHFNASQKRMYSVGSSKSNITQIPLRKLNVAGSHYQGNISGTSGAMVNWFNSNLNLFVEKIESNGWNLKAYPNPASSWLHVDLKGEATYQLLDISGRELQSGKISQEVNALSVGWLSTGTYLLRLQQEGKVATVKFVKD